MDERDILRVVVMLVSVSQALFRRSAKAYRIRAGHIDSRLDLTSGLGDFLVIYVLQRRDRVQAESEVRAAMRERHVRWVRGVGRKRGAVVAGPSARLYESHRSAYNRHKAVSKRQLRTT